MEFEEFISHFNVKTQKGNSQVQAVCPAHDDHKASLTISRGNKGNLLHCHAGCNTEDILAAVGLSQRDLFYEDRVQDSEKWRQYVENRENRKIEVVYDYVSSLNGEYCFTKLRLEGKELRYGKLVDGRFNYGIGSRRGYKAVYGSLGALREAVKEGKPVFIPEGEKDVNTLRSKGFTAITYGGVNDWQTDFSELFRGANVVVLADNDKPGRRVASQISSDLTGIAKSVKMVVPVPDTPKADISDYFECGHSTEEFLQMVDNTPAAQITVKEKPSQRQQDKPRPTRQRTGNNALVQRLRELDAVNTFSQSDMGNARMFAAVFKDVHRYNPTRRDWMVYDGIRWRLDVQGMRARQDAKRLTGALLEYAGHVDLDEKQRNNYITYILKLRNQRSRNIMIDDAKDLNFFESEELDADDFLLNCQNGVLDLSEDKPRFIEHDAGLLLSKVCNTDYNPDAKCPLWEKTVDEIMECDVEKIRYLQKVLGIALTGCTKEEELYFFYGSTSRNGKSTICETVLYLLGDYGTTISPESLAAKNKDSRQASPDLAKLQGTRFVVASEPPKRMLFDVSLVKSLTGRDSITARFLHENEFSFVPKFKLLINTNYLPVITDDTIFKSERIRVVSFNRHFEPEEQNKGLKDELRNELGGILNWMIQGYCLYKREGLEPPTPVNEATSEYRSDSDKIGKFFTECLSKSDGNISAKAVYDCYKKWCEDAGLGIEGRNNFYAELKTRNVFAPTGTVGGRTVRNIVRGYTLTDDGFMEVDPAEKLPFE